MLWDKGRDIVVKSQDLYIDIDIEADGIAGHGSILSIGAQSPFGESFYSEVKPNGSDFLPDHRQFCEDHGLEHERLMIEAPEASVVMGGLDLWLRSLILKYEKQPVFTAYNAAFDWSHVDLAFFKAGIDNIFGVAPFDLKSLAIALNSDWDFTSTIKSGLPKEIIPDSDFTHHALEDARYQQKLHFGMAALLGNKSYRFLTKGDQK